MASFDKGTETMNDNGRETLPLATSSVSENLMFNDHRQSQNITIRNSKL